MGTLLFNDLLVCMLVVLLIIWIDSLIFLFFVVVYSLFPFVFFALSFICLLGWVRWDVDEMG